MSARLYPNAFSQLANGSLVWTSLTPRALLLSSGFAYDPSIRYRDELDESFVIAESEVLTTLTYSDGVAGGVPFQWTQIADNRLGAHIIIFDDTGDDAYSELIAHYDSDSVEGLPLPVDGANYFLYPVTPPGGFFQINNSGIQVGPLNTYHVAYSLGLADGINGATYTMPVLVTGLALLVNHRICLLADELDSDNCCEPTIRSSLCG